MTKDEIKKALECCEKYAYCKDCPCYTYCRHELPKGALALITEQEKEIERLNEVVKNYKEVLCETTQRKDNAGYRREATLTCDFIKMAQKHVVQEFVDELRNKCSEVKGYYYSFGNISGVIEELLEEYKK